MGADSQPASIYVINALIANTRKRDEIARAAVHETIRAGIKGVSKPTERAFSMFVISS